MEKNNLDLFKQAINEGLSNKFDGVASSCTCEIACSEKHKLAMRTIMYGKTSEKRAWMPNTKRIVAVIVASAMLFLNCGILFLNKIGDTIKYIDGSFINLTPFGDKITSPLFKDVYKLSYVPEGYILKNISSTLVSVTYEYSNQEKVLFFEQMALGSSIYVDNKTEGEKFVSNISGLDIYYKDTLNYNIYCWNDGKYAYQILSSEELTPDDITKIIAGLSLK